MSPETKHQRCWNHRRLNLMDELPKRLQPEADARIYELYQAPSQAACETQTR